MELLIRNEYQRLSSKELKFTLIDEVKRLKDECIKEENFEYLYLCDCLITDIYLEHNNLEEPLKLLSNDIKNIDRVLYKKQYIAILERILYIYITKKNYRVAFKYAKEKIKIIDKNDIDSVNRWNLEMSYIYAEMNDYDKAAKCLLEILKDPSENILSYALSNLVKIYIDQKKVYAAEETLNKLLQIEQDEEGTIYCDYLLARICLLKDQKKEALIIFKQIFDNEDINKMTLPIVNEYLELLYNLEKYDDMGLVISKIALFINACDDYYLQKQFAKNKIKYLTAIKSVKDLNSVIEEYETIDNKIDDMEKKIMLETYEVEKDDLISSSVNDVVSKIDKITNLISSSVIGNSLRDVIMNYSKSLENVMKFDESTFVLFNKTSNIDYLLNDNVLCMNYKNSRLYEKNISFQAIKNTLAELIIDKNKQMSFDFNKSKLNIINIFNNRSYRDDQLMYVNVIPCSYQEDIFACMIYASYKTDITTQDDTVLFRVATKILESSLTSVFLSENLDVTNYTVDSIVNNNNIGLVHIANDTMYLSKPLMNYLHLTHRTILRDNYLKMINKADIIRYNETCDLSKNYEIEYNLNCDNKMISVVEEMQPYFDNNNTLLFSVGTIKFKKEDIKTLVEGENELQKRISNLKIKANKIEFKYSLIRIKTSFKDYTFLKNIFGTEPYYVDNSDFIIILENEIDQRTLDKLSSKINSPYSIIKYPKDIVNVEESFNLSKICLENNYHVFTDEIYKEYLKKKNYNKMSEKALNSILPMNLIKYESFDGIPWFEARLSFGNNGNDNIRNYLNEENKYQYDLKLFRSILDKSINANCFLALSNKAIKKLLDSSSIPFEGFENMRFIVYENDNLLKEIFEKLSQTNIKVLIDCNIINQISAYTFSSKLITGVVLGKGISNELRVNSLKLADLFKLSVVSSYKINDFYKNIYQTNEIHEVL